jgi:predicted RNA methylase
MTHIHDTNILPILQAARALADVMQQRALHLPASDAPRISRADINAVMTTAFDGPDVSGAWTQRLSFDVVEYAQTLLLQTPAFKTFGDRQDQLALLQTLASRLPTATVRSEDQISLQQFSTPLPLAVVAAQFAQIMPSDIVCEPSAGTGLLAVQATCGAQLHLNEFDAGRAACLAQLFPRAAVTQQDAIQLSALVDPALKPTIMLMNPPFSIDANGADDAFTAARHCAAAVHWLHPSGRCVAIMPAWFTHNSRYGRSFAHLCGLAGLRANILLPAAAFAKHGTSVDVRLMIFDKNTCDDAPLVEQADSLVQLLDLVPRLPRRTSQGSAASAPTSRAATVAPGAPVPAIMTGDLNSTAHTKPHKLAFLSKPARASTAVRGAAAIEIAGTVPAPLRYTALDIPRSAEPAVGHYQPYRVSRVDIPGAADHPTPLVESIAMASVACPKPRYQPVLPAHLVRDGLLSAPQLESVIYAGDAHGRFLASKYACAANGISLELAANGAAYPLQNAIPNRPHVPRKRLFSGVFM